MDSRNDSVARPGGVEASEPTSVPIGLVEPSRPDAYRNLVESLSTVDAPLMASESLPLPEGVIYSDGPPTCSHDHGASRPVLSDDFFRPAYEGYALQDYLIAKTLVEQEFFDRQNRVVAERLEAGFHETYVFERVQDLDIHAFPPHSGGGLIHSTSSRTLDDGRIESRLTFLPYEEYRGLYEKQDELMFLNHRIHEHRSGSVR